MVNYTIISLVRDETPDPIKLKEIEEKIQYHIYDTVSDDVFSDRFNLVNKIIDPNSKSLKIVPAIKIEPKMSIIDSYHDVFVKDGYEGAMVRINAPYEEKRSSVLLLLHNRL